MSIALLLRCLQRLIQIGLDVVDVFQADAHADVIVGDAGGLEFLGRLLAVGGAGRMDHQRLGVADVGQVRGQLDRLDELFRRRRGRPSRRSPGSRRSPWAGTFAPAYDPGCDGKPG